MSHPHSCTAQCEQITPRTAKTDSRFHLAYPGWLASLGLASFLLVSGPAFAASSSVVAVAPTLGTAAQFGVLGNSGVTGSAGAGTVVNGHVGSGPTSPTINNFPPSSVTAPFVLYTTANAVTAQAHTDANAAYTSLAGQGVGYALGDNLSAVGVGVLTPGVYSSGAADLGASTTLTLNDPSPDKSGIFVFNVASSLTMNGSSVVTGTADPCNVYWRVGSSATLNGTSFMGTVIADTSITVSSASSVSGRLLAGAVTGTGVVTMAVGGNTIGGCSRAKLALAKTVVNTGGGTAVAGDFTLTATGPVTISGPAPVTAANAPVGVYALTETNLTGYTAGSFSCSGGGALAGNLLTIAAADAGNTITCTITNTFTPSPARLALAKTVVNTGGGTAVAGDFTLTATGPVTISGPAPVAATNAPVGVYALTETSLTGYTAGSFSCSGGGTLAGNQLTISAADAGNTITCTVINTFTSVTLPTVTVTKVSNGGVGLFNFTGSNGFASQNITTATSGVGVAGATQTLTAAGVSTTITESAPPAGYTLASIACTGLGTGGTATPDLGTRSVALNAAATAAGAAIACTFTNTFTVAVPVTSIPTLSEWAMIMLAALMAITGVVAMRRKDS